MKIITGDLAKADPDAAAERLMRFLATADRTLARAGGAQFEAAQVYHAAAEALPGLIARLSAEEVGSLADRLYELAARSRAGVVMKPMREILARSAPAVVDAFDARLAEAVRALGPIAEDDRDRSKRAHARHLIELRQRVADAGATSTPSSHWRPPCQDAFPTRRRSPSASPAPGAIARRWTGCAGPRGRP